MMKTDKGLQSFTAVIGSISPGKRVGSYIHRIKGLVANGFGSFNGDMMFFRFN